MNKREPVVLTTKKLFRPTSPGDRLKPAPGKAPASAHGYLSQLMECMAALSAMGH